MINILPPSALINFHMPWKGNDGRGGCRVLPSLFELSFQRINISMAIGGSHYLITEKATKQIIKAIETW